MPYRIDQCRILSYELEKVDSTPSISYENHDNRVNVLDVELDCSSQGQEGDNISANLKIEHNSYCMKAFISLQESKFGKTSHKFVSGEFIGFKNDKCFENKNFSLSSVSYSDPMKNALALFGNLGEDTFIMNRDLNRDYERVVRDQDAVIAEENAARRAALVARCSNVAEEDAECAAFREAEADAKAFVEAIVEQPM